MEEAEVEPCGELCLELWAQVGKHGSWMCCVGLVGESEFLVKFVEVKHELSSSCKGKIMFGVYCDVQKISLVSKEWGYPCHSTWSIVVSEFHKQKKSGVGL